VLVQPDGSPGRIAIREYSSGQDAADALASELGNLVMTRGRPFHLALSGGASPVPGLRWLAEQVSDWKGVELWQVDERFVPPGDAGSNEGMIRRELLGRIQGDPPEFHGMVRAASAEECAVRYERDLPERFDCVLLGMGEDGHTASLFPGSPALYESQRRVVAAPGAAPYPERMTLTIPSLVRSDQIMALITGGSKRRVLGEVLRADSGLPMALVLRAAESCEIFVDGPV